MSTSKKYSKKQVLNFKNRIFSVQRPKSKFCFLQLFELVPRTYPESFRMILQKLQEEIDFKVVFQGTRLKIALAIQLYCSADLQVVITSARNNNFSWNQKHLIDFGLLYQKQPKSRFLKTPTCPLYAKFTKIFVQAKLVLSLDELYFQKKLSHTFLARLE